MARINLLPWREALRKQQQKDFFSIIGGAVLLTVTLLLYSHIHINGLIGNQNRRNQFLETEISILNRKIKEIDELEEKKRRLIAKMDVIQQLQGSRPEIVHLFDDLAKTIPDGVNLTKLLQTEKKLALEGFAQSNARVSAYMRNLEASLWVTNPKLNVIETKGQGDQGRVSRFTLDVEQSSTMRKRGSGGEA